MIEYIKGFFDKTDPTKSLKHAAYAIGVCSSVCWLSHWVWVGPKDANFVAAFGLFLAAIVTGKVVEGTQNT